MFEEALVHIEAHKKLVCRSIRQDQPHTVGGKRGDGRTADDPAYLHLDLSLCNVRKCAAAQSSGSRLRCRRPAAGAVGPVGGERALALPTASLAGRRSPAISTRRVDAGLFRLALVDAFLELLETRPKRPSKLWESVRAEQDQHDD